MKQTLSNTKRQKVQFSVFSHWPPRQSVAGEHDTWDEAGTTKPAQLGEEKAGGDLTAVYNDLTERHQKDVDRLFSKVHRDSKKYKGWKLKYGASHVSHTLGKKIYQEGGQTLIQAPQRRCAVSSFGDVQDSPVYGLEQPGLVRPVLRRLEVPSNLNDDSLIIIMAWWLLVQR